MAPARVRCHVEHIMVAHSLPQSAGNLVVADLSDAMLTAKILAGGNGVPQFNALG